MFNPFGGRKKKGDGFPAEGSFGAAGRSRPPERKIIPTDEVRALSSRGVSEPDIIMTLKREGYSNTEIDQSMKEALRSRVSGDFYNRPAVNEYGEAPLGPPPESVPSREDMPRNLAYPIGGPEDDEEMPDQPFDPQSQAARAQEFPDMPGGEYFEPAPPRRMPQRGPTKGGMERKEVEELTEVIVEEKLRDIRDRFRSVEMQFQQTNRKVDSVSDEINRMRLEKSNEVKGIESKIDGYSRNMDAINGRMESMEKALKDSLSPMLESMRSLSELVRSMREKGK
jgi:hypothetical protein